jgi:hypothetical protein
MLVTVKTVPKGRVGLAHLPGGAAAYHVAWPRSDAPVVVGRGAGVTGVTAAAGVTLGATVGVTGADVAWTVEVCSGAAVTTGAVVGVEGATVVGVGAPPAASSYVTICEGRTTL